MRFFYTLEFLSEGQTMYDIIIIGAGPAGISASLYAKRANMNVLVLYFGESNLEKATEIENYYGFNSIIEDKDK